MQMSRHDLFVFVEGGTDRYFYGLLCDHVIRDPLSYELVSADELPGGNPGKPGLLAAFRYLRSSHGLADSFQGKRTYVVFFLDKDIDDVLRVRLRSPHLHYTPMYELENHLFSAGDVCASAAATASLDPATLRRHIASADSWRLRVARSWQLWVVLCIVSRRFGTASAVNYGRGSLINAPRFGPVDQARVEAQEVTIRTAAGCSAAEYAAMLDRVSRVVAKYYRRGDADRLFRGKWYGEFLAADVKIAAGSRRVSLNAFAERIVNHLASSVDKGSQHLASFRAALTAGVVWLSSP
jgi:hypothetical protein